MKDPEKPRRSSDHRERARGGGRPAFSQIAGIAGRFSWDKQANLAVKPVDGGMDERDASSEAGLVKKDPRWKVV